MKTFLLLFLVILVAGGLIWYFTAGQEKTEVQQFQEDVSEGAEKIKEGVKEAGEEIKEKIGSINTEEIKEELRRTGKVVRRKAEKAGEKIGDMASNAKTTATIKGKYALDPDLSALTISIDTTGDLVTLSGTVNSFEHIGKAMELALETEGVREVVSTLQVRQAREAEQK